jgi:hypothetical protein
MSLLTALLVICAAAASFMWRFARRLERRAGPWIAAPARETLSVRQVQHSVAHAQNADARPSPTGIGKAGPKAVASSRLDALDLLRLVAVLMVVFYHYGFWGRQRRAFRRSRCPVSPPSRSTASWAFPSSS